MRTFAIALCAACVAAVVPALEASVGPGTAERATRPVPGTEGVEDTSIFVSPDGRWVGFYRDETLWKTPINGGIHLTIGSHAECASSFTNVRTFLSSLRWYVVSSASDRIR